MRRLTLGQIALFGVFALLVSCGQSSQADGSGASTPGSLGLDGSRVKGPVGFILPGSTSSDRWETLDRPAIKTACEEAGIECVIQNAEGDPEKMKELADQLIDNGILVLALVNLDPESAAEIQKAAAASGVKNIDYDRLTVGGYADVYVSFDSVEVGVAQGEGLIECFEGETNGKRIIQLDGSPTDNNATLVKEGHARSIEGAGFTIVGEAPVPNWDAEEAEALFSQLYDDVSGEIDGVLAANDGLSIAAQKVLAGSDKKLPATGQDATLESLRAILEGSQCMTVYKPVAEEARGAVEVADLLMNGEEVTAGATVDTGNAEIPYVQAEIRSIFRSNLAKLVEEGFVPLKDLCSGLEDECTEFVVTG